MITGELKGKIDRGDFLDGWCYKSANNVVLEFLRDETLNINQMEFVKLIVNYIIDNRIMDMTMFERYRVNKFGSA